MLSPLANLNVRVGADIKEFEAMATKMEKALAPVRRRLKGMGTALSVGVTAPLLAIATKGVQAWDKQAKAVAKVENAILSTGGAAGRTLEQLQQKASELQSKTLFGDEEILDGATAQLLTFTNIAGEQFERTQAVALDLATMLGGDLKSASIQLGKALNDPVANLSALSRSGIQFSADQKDVIKSLAEGGRLAEAQNVILQELERQYGGTAAAAAAAGTGPLTQLNNSIGDLTEEVGALAFDALRPLIGGLTEVIGWFTSLPESTKKTIIAIAAVAASVGPLLLSLGGILKLVPLISAGFTLLTGPVGLLVAAGAALAAGAVLIYKNWDKLREQFGGPVSAAMERFRGLFDTLKATATDVLGSVQQLLSGFVTGAIAAWDALVSASMLIWDRWGDSITNTFDFIIDVIGTGSRIVGDIFGALVDLLTGNWTGLWERLKSIVQTAANFIVRTVLSMVDSVLAGIENLFSWIPGAEGVVASARSYIQELRKDFAEPIVLGPIVPSSVNTGDPKAKLPERTKKDQPAGQVAGFGAVEGVAAAGLQSLGAQIPALELPPVDFSAFHASISDAADSASLQLDRLQTYFVRTHERMQDAIPEIANTIKAGFEDAAVGMLEGIGKMAVGADTAGGVANKILTSLAGLAVQVGQIAIGVGLGVEGIKKALSPPFPAVAAIAAGAALIAIGSAAKAALSRSASGGGGGSSVSTGASGGFGEQSLFQNANAEDPNAAQTAARKEAVEVRVTMESSATAAGNIAYSFKQGSRRLARQGTDER